MFFHDIGWPYARRDLYYDPDTIPAQFRNPYEQKGMAPGQAGLLEQGGLNSDMYNAVSQGDCQNGVLTAIEDFLDSTSADLEMVTIPGLYGLGIMYPKNLRIRNLEFDGFIANFEMSDGLRHVVEKIETDRILKQMAINRRNDELETVRVANNRIRENHQIEIAEMKDRFFQETDLLKKKIRRREKSIQGYRENNDALQRQNEQLQSYLRSLRVDLIAMVGSNRWKMGDAIGETIRKLTMKEKVPMALDNLNNTFARFENWRPSYEEMIRLRKNQERLEKIFYEEDKLEYLCKNRFSTETTDLILRTLESEMVCIVVPIYNAYRETKACLESVMEQTTIPYELILIDDASTDDRVGTLLDHYGRLSFVRVIKNPENLGFVKTANIGIKAAKGDVVLLNSDTIVTSRWLQKMMIAAYQESSIATVTPFSNAAGAFSVPAIGKNDILPHLTLDKTANVVERESRMIYPRVPTGNGYCLYIKRTAIDDIGFFDEDHFERGYGEENDFCMRCLKKGWHHVIDDATFIFHKNSASFSGDKQELMKKNRKVLDRLHPEYTGQVQKFINSFELKTIRAAIKEKLEEKNTAPKAMRVLYVLHEGSGGTPATNRDLMLNISRDHECFLLTSTGSLLILRYMVDGRMTDIFRWQLSQKWSAMDMASDELRGFYFSLLVNLKIEVVHIRHLFKHSLELPRICRTLGLSVVLSFHDFYHICPSIHLLDQDTRYCAGTCGNGDGQCRIPSPDLADLPELRAWLPQWRKEISQALGACNVLITTSQFAKKLYEQVYPELKRKRFRVIEHGRDFPAVNSFCATVPKEDEKVKILVPGNIDVHKGSRFIKELCTLDAERRLELHFIGSIPDDLKECGIYHGTYSRNSFHRKYLEIRPSFVGIFSIWPETYCHTLSEAWACQVPVLSFDIGAVGERVARNEGGWFLDMENLVKSYQTILDIASDQDEYRRILAKVKTIEFKTTRKMADDYLKEYGQARHMNGNSPFNHHTVALFSPQGTHGYPGSSYVRCLRPLQHPSVSKRVSVEMMPIKTDPAYLEGLARTNSVDLVMIQRDALIGARLDMVLAWCRENKFPIIYEIDDNLIGIDASHPEYEVYKPRGKAVEQLCHSAEVTLVSTPQLKESLTDYSSNIKILPNALDEVLWFLPLSHKFVQRPDKVIHVGYMGTFTHDNDLKLVSKVIPEVKAVLEKKYGITMHFFMIGGGKDENLDPSWYHRIDIPVKESVYPRFVNWLRRNVDWDIAIAPLDDTVLNKSKSELKFFEYTALGAAGIYSDFGGYSKTITHRENGMLVKDNSVDKWKAYLVELAVNKEIRNDLVARAKTHVIGNCLLKQRALDWLSVFDDIL